MFTLATLIFVISYALIVSEKVHKTKVALLGAGLVLISKILTQDQALRDVEMGVDWNVIFLLISMMVIVNIMTKTGVFEFLAVKAAKLSRGRPVAIMVIFAVVTAIGSAFLDNVTTVLLLAPVTLLIAEQLEVDPVPFLITEALASNIGGTATLIGDPPNIMIASKAGFEFVDFILHLAPIIIIIMIIWLALWALIFRNVLTVDEEKRQRILSLDESELIRDKKLLVKSLIVLGLTILGFICHGALHYEAATVALAGAGLLLFISGQDPEEVLSSIEWPTLFFFMGLFIIIGATVKVGLIEMMSDKMITLTNPSKDNMMTLSLVMVWFSSIASAIVDNIPFVATINPLLIDMAGKVFGVTNLAPGSEILRSAAMEPVWWSLALGACLGGNGSAIGASANVIVVGLSEKAGHKITFIRFFKYGAPVMLLTIILATIYIYLRYYVLQW
ncbi:ArsB/NhaD family transporter [Desulfovibrio inopinatus]|uniref:ArsB/NhaD family transporter n=1 Tax=Desulfovibrio inopinatus TaxID=102109 RepID=UPI000415F511|nr:ArsB/NhaD family transporter [Desulfovibrio inopinatus]